MLIYDWKYNFANKGQFLKGSLIQRFIRNLIVSVRKYFKRAIEFLLIFHKCLAEEQQQSLKLLYETGSYRESVYGFPQSPRLCGAQVENPPPYGPGFAHPTAVARSIIVSMISSTLYRRMKARTTSIAPALCRFCSLFASRSTSRRPWFSFHLEGMTEIIETTKIHQFPSTIMTIIYYIFNFYQIVLSRDPVVATTWRQVMEGKPVFEL